MTTTTQFTTSTVFCCRHCGADVALEPSADLAGLYYVCQNSACQWACEVDCFEALGIKPEATPATEVEAERARDFADLERYSGSWDAFATTLAEPTTTSHQIPAPTPAQQRAENKAQWHLSQGLKIAFVGDAALVPSGTRGGIVHRVEQGICSCEAAQNGRLCWHLAAVELSSQGVEFGRAA